MTRIISSFYWRHRGFFKFTIFYLPDSTNPVISIPRVISVIFGHSLCKTLRLFLNDLLKKLQISTQGNESGVKTGEFYF